MTKVEAMRPLELAHFGAPGGVPVRSATARRILESPLARALNAWKLVYRAMPAEDMLLFAPAQKAKAALLAMRAARDAARTILAEQSFLQGMMDLFTVLSEANPEPAPKRGWRLASRTGTSLVVPTRVRQIDKLYDPAVYDACTLEGILVQQVPFTRRTGEPALNSLGRPVESPVWARDLRLASEDPLVRLLARHGAWPRIPDRNQIYRAAGRPMRDEECYRYVRESGRLVYTRLDAERRAERPPTLGPREKEQRVRQVESEARQEIRERMGF